MTPVKITCHSGFYAPAIEAAQVVGVAPNAPRAVIRQRIEALEARMLQMPQVEIPPAHYFAQGLYAREIRIPKGTLLTGKIHRGEHLNIISQGDISVVTEDGVRRIRAPFTMVSLPGTKRVGFAHEDTVWTTIHATPETDLERLELALIAPSFDEVELLADPDVALLAESLKGEV